MMFGATVFTATWLRILARFSPLDASDTTKGKFVAPLLTYLLTYLLTPWSRVLLEKLTRKL